MKNETKNSSSSSSSSSSSVTSLKILLDHPQGVYYPGNNITGKIIFHINEETEFLALRLNCLGEGLVFFTDRSAAGFRRIFTNNESYISKEIFLFGNGGEDNENTKVTIPSGENVYQFSILLPDNIPWSFEGRYGRVRYSMTAFLQENQNINIKEYLPFTMAPILDLNKDSLAPLPISEDNSKIVMGHNEPLKMSVNIPVRGFVPGQTIPVKIILENLSNIEIRKLRVVFKKVINYHALRKSRIHKEIIVEIEIPINKKINIYETGVDVPSVPPTGILFSNIINLWYTLKVEAYIQVNEWYFKIIQKNLKTRMTIVVGTIPLRNYETPEERDSVIEEKQQIAKIHLSDATTSATTYENHVKNEKIISKDFAKIDFYEESKIYPSSKPNRDDPTGIDEEDKQIIQSYAPLYKVYTFKKQEII